MPQSLSAVYIHLVFSTKERRPFLRDEIIRTSVHSYLGGISSVSCSNLDQVKRYIEHQGEHHRKFSFQDELRALFQKHRVDWDERYVWD